MKRHRRSLALAILAGAALIAPGVWAQVSSLGTPMDATPSFQTCTSGWCGSGSGSDRAIFIGETARLQAALPQLSLAPVDTHGFGSIGGQDARVAPDGSLPVVLSRVDAGPSTVCRLAYDTDGAAGRDAWMDALSRVMEAHGTPPNEARQSAAAFMAARGVGECLDELERRYAMQKPGLRDAVPGVFVQHGPDDDGSAGLDSHPVQFAADEAVADAFGFLWCARAGCATGLSDAVLQTAGGGAYGHLFHNPGVPHAVATRLHGTSGDPDVPSMWEMARSIQKSVHENNLHVTVALKVTYSPDVALLISGASPSVPQRSSPVVQPMPRSMDDTATFGGSGLGVACTLSKDGKAHGCDGAGHP